MLQISAGALTPACDRNPMSVVRDTVVDMPPRESPSPRWCAVGRSGTAPGGLAAVELDESGGRSPEIPIPAGGLANFVAAREAEAPRRWVWADTPAVYPALLAAGVRVERCHDLRLCHQILRNSVLVRDRAALRAATQWAVVPDPVEEPRAPLMPALFELEAGSARRPTVPDSLSEALAEFDRQRAAIDSAAEPNRIALLLAAESVGALIAVELTSAGVPWDTEEHDRILSEALGSRPAPGAKPAALLAVGEEVRAALGDPAASLDSPPKLLRALRAAGIEASSTSRWELAEHEHPAIPPLLHYKKLARLFTANGWAWIDEWVRDGRYRPVYVPGGVVTGRWASSGGGALQLPRGLRPALRADPGWRLVSADVAQLEPRVLAAMAGDRAMAAAARGTDLYTGIVESGIVTSRQEAKIAVLGAMYGGTTGDSGRLVPRLRRGFPRAMRLVDQAAAVGEQGGIVSTWLGRSSPEPGSEWRELQSRASLPGATSRDEDRARRAARDFGRFTRNFVVQGTAAEWALAWLAEVRQRLAGFALSEDTASARASGPVFERRAHLVFFLHDEVIVHAPEEQAEAAAVVIREAAEAAGKLLFGNAPVDFPLDLRISERAVKD